MAVRRSPLLLALDVAAGRRASGDPSRIMFDVVELRCWRCGGVTKFPALPDRPRRPGRCVHCGVEV